MIPWFLRDPQRLQQERTGVDEMLRSVDWLIGAEWQLDVELCLDAVIRAHGHDYEVRVSFPSLYPDAPAIVRTRNMQSRISQHQYGEADGPLCLEWGPDNWHRDVTGVQMLESAHRLFHIENPLGQDPPEVPVVAPSRHQLTIGQELRGKWVRWYSSESLVGFLAAQPKNSVGSFKFSFRKVGEDWIAMIHEAMPLAGETWKDLQIPTTLPGAGYSELLTGIWFKTDLDASTIGEPSKLAALRDLLTHLDGTKFLATDGTSPIEGFHRPIAGVLVSDRSGDSHLFVVLSGETVIRCSMVRSETVPLHSRAPDFIELSGKSIGIVGLGSAGSKIAISLARMGVRQFYIADHDLLLPENLQRHALDWQGVIRHKVDALATAISQIVPDAEVDVSRLHLTGQESNASVNGVLMRLGDCDLIVDATANSKVFNLLAAVARIAGRPLVWLEVFGGGIGGLVARSRPGLDPSPQDMRGAYLQYCDDHPDQTAQAFSKDYVTEMAHGEVLVASDADIAVIAHHAARFVSDCFAPPERSKFPYSMYLIGLTRAWVFEAPFATIPISMASFPAAEPQGDGCAELGPENVAFLLQLIKKRENAPAHLN